MERSHIIRRSPIVLIRFFTIIEALAFVGYSIAALLGNYKYEFYLQLPLAAILPYHYAKFLFLSGAQLIITIYAFLRWYYESFMIRPDSIIHRWGVFFRNQEVLALERRSEAGFASGPLGKLLHYGTITVHTGEQSLTLTDISYPGDNTAFINQCIEDPEHTFRDQVTPSRLLNGEEHERLEFKSSLRFDHKTQKVNRDLEKSALKTIAGFLNSKGGYLLIGIGNSRELLGIEYDYQTLGRQNTDGFENHFTQIFNTSIGPEFRHLVRLQFPTLEGRNVCIVNVSPSARPVYLKLDDTEHFYVRTGNVTTPLKLSEVEAYVRTHWPHQTA